MRSQVLVLCVCVGMCVVECGNILAILPFIGKSHFFSYEPILAALARRGHDVTVVSKFPRTSPLKGYTDIDIRNPDTTEVKINLTKIEIFGLSGEEMMEEIEEFLIDFESVFKRDDFQRLLHGNVSFDLVITEIFVSDMFTGVAYKCNAPLVGIISSTVLPWANDRFGIPDNPSYIRSTFYPGVGEMTFYDRILNTFALIISKVFYDYYIASRDEAISKRYLGSDMPHIKDIVKNTSLLLINSHFSLNQARPFPPNVIEISGAHLKQLKPLPQDIQSFLDESKNGVVYFSLGTIVDVSSMSELKRRAFCDSFAKLKQRVLWKWELGDMPDKPANVKTVKWMPQAEVLAHPNVRVFIGHGGLLGTIESVSNGVPMIGIPVFGDQHQNIETLVNFGTAVALDFAKLDEDSLTKALNAVLFDSKYKTNAKLLSDRFNDKPLAPIDTATFWIEYVMRHRGAHHLRPSGVHLPWYQYFLLDVILLLLLFVIVVIYFTTLLVKKIYKLICIKDKIKLKTK